MECMRGKSKEFECEDLALQMRQFRSLHDPVLSGELREIKLPVRVPGV